MKGKGFLRLSLAAFFALSLMASNATAANQWLPKGPPGADVECIAVNPKNTSIMYMGTLSANGIFKTTNGGATWALVTNGISNVKTFDIAINPSNPNIILAACFGRTDAQSGVYRSTDGGNHWVQKIKNGIRGRNVVFDPKKPSLAYAGTDGWGVYTSTDSGNTWKGPSAMYSSFYNRAMAIDSLGTVYIGTTGNDSASRGVWSTIDGGTTWTKMGGTSLHTDVRSLAVDPNDNLVLYAGVYGGFVYKTIDGGDNWTPLDDGHGSAQDTCAVLVDPYNSQTIYAGTLPYGVLKSTNGGTDWSPFNDGLPVVAVMALRSTPKTSNPSNQILFLGSFGGVYRRSASAPAWTAINTGLHHYSVNGIASWETNNIVAAVYGIGIAKSTNGGATWAFYVPDSSNRRSIYSKCLQRDDSGNMYLGTEGAGVYKSSNGGSIWVAVNTGLESSEYWIESLLSTDNAIYAGTYEMGIYRSVNGGNNWSQINAGLPSYYDDPYTWYAGVQSIASDYGTTDTLYIGCIDRHFPQEDTDCRMFKSTNGGDTWNALDPGGEDIKAIYRGIAVDDQDPSIIYATGDNPFMNLGGLYLKLGDYGDSIVSYILGEGIGNNVFVYDNGYVDGVGLCTEGKGIWDSWDGGLSFYPMFPNSLANLYVKCITGGYNPSGGNLIMVGTDGGGLFEINLLKGVVLEGPQGGNPNPDDPLGAVMFKGTPYKITWDYWGFGGNATLELYQNGKKKGIIATLNVDECEYNWTVGKTKSGWAPLGSGYRVKIRNSDNSCSDTSDMAFNIRVPGITVDSPKGGEKWLKGSSQDIKWTALSVTGNLVIELVSGTKTLGTIATVPQSPPEYSWTVGSYSGSTAPLGTTYKIRVKAEDNSFVGLSKSNFSIIGTIAVTSPNGGEQWAQSSIQNITWNSAGLSGTATLELWKGSAKLGVITTVADVTAGSYSWTVGSYGVGKIANKGTGYKVKIICSGISDTSNAAFTIN